MALSDQTLREITEYIEGQGREWAKEFIAGRRAWMQSKGIRASGALMDSLRAEVLTTLEQAATVRLELEFKDYGRYVEMRNLKPPAGGDDYLKGLEQWIEKKGLRQRFTDRYLKQRNVRSVPPSILNQLAWSIAIKRQQRYRRRQWYNKPKSAAITELYNRVAANLPDLVMQELKAAFKQ